MVLLIPDDMNLAAFENKMTKQMFDMYFDPSFKPDPGHGSLLYRENLVNLTLPLFSETYVNQHLDKSLLQVHSSLPLETDAINMIFQRYGVKKLQTRSAELWSMSATPTAHLSAMLQRTHFELVIENPDILSKHKKRERRTKKRNRRKSKRTATSIVVNKYNEDDEKVRLTKNEDGTEVLSLLQQGNGFYFVHQCFLGVRSVTKRCKLQRTL